MSWICCHPIFDDVTVITDGEAKDAIDYMKKHNVQVIDLPDEKAVRTEVEEAFKQNPEANIGHWNHGSPEAWYGDDEKPLLNLNNVKLLKGREAFASNCSSAKKLGVEAFKHGCKVYFGYKDVVSFTTDALEEFQEAFNHWIKRRIDGFSPIEALQKTKEKMTELADKLVAEGKILAASCMRRDRDIMVCFTEDTPPEETDCPLRRLAIKLFGAQIGWKLSRKFTIGTILSWFGYGGMIHDFILECQHISNPWRLHGFWIYLGCTIAGFFILTYDYVKWLKSLNRQIL